MHSWRDAHKILLRKKGILAKTSLVKSSSLDLFQACCVDSRTKRPIFEFDSQLFLLEEVMNGNYGSVGENHSDIIRRVQSRDQDHDEDEADTTTRLMGESGKGNEDSTADNVRFYMSLSYMAAMGVCGMVLVAIGQTLSALAENMDMIATSLGSVFLGRGAGAILGAVMSAKLYVWFRGNFVMAFGLAMVSMIFLLMPFNKSYIMLHLYFFFLGLATSVTDTGCQIMTRKLHGKKAGPWLGANTVAFGIAGAIVPIVEVATKNIVLEFYVLAGLVFSVAAFVVATPDVDSIIGNKNGGTSSKEADENKGGPGKRGKHYHVEMLVSLMVFLFIGSKVTLTSYLYSFVEQTHMIEPKYQSRLLLVLWISITIGRLAGVYDQRFLSNQTLPVHLFVQSLGATLSMVLILLFPHKSTALWIGIAFFGIFNGPCVGYCYDLNNRLTYPSEMSMAIVMLGLNFGASLVPFVASWIWHEEKDPWVLIWVAAITNAIPLGLIFVAKRLSYDPSVNPYIKVTTQDAA